MIKKSKLKHKWTSNQNWSRCRPFCPFLEYKLTFFKILIKRLSDTEAPQHRFIPNVKDERTCVFFSRFCESGHSILNKITHLAANCNTGRNCSAAQIHLSNLIWLCYEAVSPPPPPQHQQHDLIIRDIIMSQMHLMDKVHVHIAQIQPSDLKLGTLRTLGFKFSRSAPL